jgi:hypothetical protein
LNGYLYYDFTKCQVFGMYQSAKLLKHSQLPSFLLLVLLPLLFFQKHFITSN